ncbi:RHS repeat-associated core domain-containing protein [Bathymodiolus thermophilus thioautotrophic gill symbiont]|nr:RHS repeat-associated core domain-containing protein [Bathymodiolus thermophilus thioautotrophic gill symbiont]
MQTQVNIHRNIQRTHMSSAYLKGTHGNTDTLISNTTNDDGGIGSNSKVTFTANTSNTYYISASAYSNNTGTYTLTATATGSNANITPNPSDNYLYDANGNMTQNNKKLIQWTSFNKPKRFTNSNDTTAFAYAPNRNRYQKTQTKANSNSTITTTYIGKLYEQIKQNTHTEHKHFIYADGQLIAINIKTNTTANTPSIPDKTRYLHYDNLGSIGSIDTITNGQGNIVERMAYTAFGQRRQGDWRASDPLLPIIPTLTNRGFTGHEHIDEMGFIHMNGRVYDPSIGRFLSADPNIQVPYNTQSYNRYSYVLNNPLKYTDPSGFFLRKMFGLSDKISKRFSPIGYAIQRSIEKAMMKNSTLRAIGMIAASAFGGPAGAAAFSARMAYLSGGNDGDIFKAAAVSFASASAAGYIGHGGVDGAPIVEGAINKAIAHGLAQGAISQISGGNFQDGFVGGFIGSVAGSSMGEGGDWSDIAGRTAIAATAGGITAELGGGKFSNGARSAAFVHLFNHEGGNISKALTPDSIVVPGFEGKIGVLTVNLNPATLEINMQNPYNSNSVLSSKYSGTIFGFGVSRTRYSYDLGKTWSTPIYGFASDWGVNNNGSFVYKTGIGFRRGNLDWQYDFDVPVGNMIFGRPVY